MSTIAKPGWPLAFFILNLAAIAFWFHATGVFEPGAVSPRSFSPSGSELDAGAVTHIDVAFDSPLDPSSVGPHSVRLHPPAAGAAELVDGRTLRYTLSEKLQPATSYRLSWSNTLRGEKGQGVNQELYTFATARPALLSASQAGFDADSYTVRLSFNQPVRAEALAAALSSRFSGDDGFRRDERRARVISSADAREHRVRVSAGGADWVVLRLKAGMVAAVGNLGLERDVDLAWRVNGAEGDAPEWARGDEVRDLRPELTFLGLEAGWSDGAGVIIVRASSPLDSAAAAKHVAIDPEVKFTCLPYWGGMKITGDFEPGRQYRVTLRSGLPAGAAGELASAVARNVWFDDRPASLEFTFGGGYLLPGGMLTVPITSVNTDRFTLRLRRLYPDNLVEMALGDSREGVEEDYAGAVKETEIRPAGKRNEKVETLVDLRPLLDGKTSGVYGLEIFSPDNVWRKRRAAAIVSDIGLGARLGRDQIFAWTMSLEGGVPLPGAEIRVYSNRRQFLASGITGEDGTLALELPPLPDGERPMLALASAGGESTFVHLGNHQNSRGATLGGGSPHPGAYQAFVATDRGVYRGGETARVSLLVRDRSLATVPAMPVEILLSSADGKIRSRLTRTTDRHGRVLADLPLARDIASGLYQVRAALPGHAGDLGLASLRVADYIPETLRLSLSLADGILPERPSRLSLRATRLAGGETGRLPGRVLAEYRPEPFRHDNWKDWTFGDHRLNSKAGKTVERNLVTDPDGGAVAEWSNPAIDTPAAIAMSVRAEIMEPGGRAISETARGILHPSPFYLGVKPEAAAPRAGDAVSFLLIAVTPEGKNIVPPSGWHARVYRVEHNSLLRRRDDGRLVYDWQRRDILEGEETGAWGNGRARLSFPALAGGEYRLVVESDAGKAVTCDFSVQGGEGGWTGSDPEALALAPSRPRHSVGSTAEVTVKAPFAGRAVVTVEGDRVLRHWVREMKEGENTLEIPVDESMRPNAYVAVTLVRPVKAEAIWRPHRAVGAVSLEVDNGDRRLTAAIDAPETIAPGEELAVAVRVAGPDGAAVPDAAVILWGVDEGVLGLTDYRTPSPWEYFYRKRRLDVVDADMYSRLAPELTAWRQGRTPLPGGGDGPTEAARRLNPISVERVKAAVVFRGDLTTDAEGVATATLPVPEIATKMRLMAWAGAGDKMGAGEKGVEVKAPVSFLASWPRFAAPGDEFQVAVTLLNRSGGEAEATLSVIAASGLELTPATQSIVIPNEETRQVVLKAKALATGKASATLRASLSDASFRQDAELAVRPPVLFQRRSGVEEIAPGGEARLIPAGDLLTENGRLKVTVGGNPQIKLAGVLEYLVGYPYACGEQTASRLAALVAVPDLLALSRPGQLGAEEAAAMARSCLDRLEQLQASNGGIRMWPGWEEPRFWLTAQALYLLEECRERGWTMPDSLVERAREYLGNRLDEHVRLLEKEPLRLEQDEIRYANGEDAALACLALARGNALRRSWLVRTNEIAAERAKAGRPLASQALAFLCHATLAAGDPRLARELFDRHRPDGSASGVVPASAFAHAAWLAAGVRLGVPRADLAGLAARLERVLPESHSQWNTRESVWALLALGAYWQRFRPDPESAATVTVNGDRREFAMTAGSAWPGLTPGAIIVAEARGPDPLHLVWTAEGVPVSGQAREEDVGMRVRRRVFAANDEELRWPFLLAQGEVYRIRLEVEGEADDLVIADLLPAGLEVEDPRLKGRDGEQASGMRVEQVERRDDRLLLFGAVRGNGRYEYLCRAVTPGEYVWPAVDAGRMYDSSVRSVHGGTRLTVRAPEGTRHESEEASHEPEEARHEPEEASHEPEEARHE